MVGAAHADRDDVSTEVHRGVGRTVHDRGERPGPPTRARVEVVGGERAGLGEIADEHGNGLGVGAILQDEQALDRGAVGRERGQPVDRLGGQYHHSPAPQGGQGHGEGFVDRNDHGRITTTRSRPARSRCTDRWP